MLSALYHTPPIPLPTPINWENLIAEAAHQRLLPSLNRQTHALNPPQEIKALLTTTAHLNNERNQTILEDAHHATALLNQIGIQPVALKGLAYLLTKTYPNPADRYLLDLDLLLPADQLPLAAAHLKKHGYIENESNHFLQFRHHHPALRRPGRTHIELHHRVGQGICNKLLPPQTLLKHATPLTFRDATFLIPTPTHLANHLILHSQLAHPYHDRIFPSLRALVDLAHLQTRYPSQIDWPFLAKTYQEKGEAATLFLHLHQARQILGIPIPRHLPTKLPFFLRLRFEHRSLLNQHPKLRHLDLTYLFMSLFSRRIRLLPFILQTPSSWHQVFRVLTRPAFYRNLIG